ncbi:rRNA-processing protein efg1-like [Cynara cardunculus var. scolymus]|uniref:rRNA-processing protein EFG1 n=1 Tax=Cynara cardunculus var. scolymus TaxID=59895 RepID=A0A103R5W8_CYNCS|nr:rRNA-processing protein efg1-like [Cynara cardunculus var. scolymus]KVG61807.1 rRNA-processing protein EFG1 [Cynara cardunculus var. scolymus]
MAHGGYDKRRVAGRKPVNKATNHRPKALGVEKKPKAKLGSLKRQIRSTERLLRKDTRPEVKEALTKKLEGLKNQQQVQDNLALERKIFLRDRKIKFFERRKVERRIRRLEKQQRASSGQAQEPEIVEQLSRLKEDLEYIRFFPKTEKYVSLFKKGDNMDTVDKRNSLRTQIKANIAAAVASGKDLEETGSDDDGLDLSEDDFFVSGSSSDEADADDEWTDKSAREQASSASGKAASGMSSDERNQRHISARALMPPPRASNGSSAVHVKSRYSNSFNKNSSFRRRDMSSSSNTSTSVDRPSFENRRPYIHTGNSSSNLSSNSDARKPKRKRRPKKKKQQG